MSCKSKSVIRELQTLQLTVAGISATALYDTEANMSCMSYTCYAKLKDPPPSQNIHALSVHSAAGHDSCPMRLLHC